MKENYNVIGVMSGTSLDGVDLAHILFTDKDYKWNFSIGKTATIPYSVEWIERLKAAINFDEIELEKLNEDYTRLLGNIIKSFIDTNEITDIVAVCSHGHTILHQPHNGFTLQIGNLPEIAAIVDQTVVCNFRVQDVQLGGQGAPLVPIGDRLLFSDYDFCLNLGGFSNISFEEKGERLAFDICPVNTVLNFYANQLGFDYDAGGAIAESGTILFSLLEELNALEFYYESYPKSLGFEFVRDIVVPIIEKHPASPKDRLATFTEHTAVQIAKVVNALDKGKLLVTGGGAYNTFLINRIASLLVNVTMEVPDDKTIQFKEALIFAFLGVLKLRNEINVLSSVTGAKRDHSSGYIFKP